MNEGDAEPLGVRDVAHAHGFALPQDFARVRFMNARERLHERAFAGAVFAHHGGDFARAEGGVHSIQREHAGEAFAHAAGFQQRGAVVDGGSHLAMLARNQERP